MIEGFYYILLGKINIPVPCDLNPVLTCLRTFLAAHSLRARVNLNAL